MHNKIQRMKTEISAGAVVVTYKEHEWNVLLIRDMNGNLTFPKGLVEKNEELVDTARREAREETGVTDLHFRQSLAPIHYFYTRNAEKISKTVTYILFESTTKQQLAPQKEEGISEVLWMPLGKTIENIGYPKTNKPILEEIRTLLYDN